MKKSSAVIMAFAALACGCTMEIHPDAPMAEKTVFTVSAPSTRTVVGDAAAGSRQLYWADGDCLAVNGIASEALSGVPAESTNASFTVNGTLTAPYDAVYPASIWKDASTVTLPATVQNGVLPLGGRSNDPDLALSPLTSCLHLALKQSGDASPDIHQIAYVEISTESVRMNGDFTVDFENAGLTPAAGASADECKVRVAGPWDLPASGALDLFVPVPAGTYSFSVKILDVKGHFMTVSTTGSKNMDKGVIKAFPAIEFKPTGTQFDVVITSASDLVTFAQEYNAKAYESLGGDLKVGLEQDITFDATTSADFNSTGGIGLKEAAGDAEDFYFSGLFDGQGHTIAGLAATVPVFKATQDAGTVKDLTVDGTCSFTFTHPNTTEAMFGSVVGYHKGVLDNVKVAADISLAAVADVTKMTTLGGLAGRTTVGKLQNGCEYSGLISTPAGFTTTGKLIIGGLVGRFSNAGSISDSFFKGAISNEAQVTSTDKTNPYLIIGGIVGHADGGSSITSCSTTADHALIEGAYTGTQGHIVNKTLKAYHSVTGGIVGEVNDCTVSSCTNNAAILITIIRNTDDDSLARIIKTGGIVGKNGASGTIDGCTNNGNIQNNSNTRLQAAGGIAGLNAGAIQGDESVNKGNIAFGTTGVDPIYGARIPYIGGIIGENTSSSVSNVRNEGSVELSRTEMSSTGFRIALGGIIGWNSGSLNGGPSKTIVNTGLVYFNTNVNKISAADGYYLGGIVGITSGSVQNAKNAGYINFRWTHTSRVVEKAYLGGIAGKMDGDGTFSGCVNEGGSGNAGEVLFNVANGGLHSNNHVGGILGYSDKNISITDCVNSGNVHTSNYTAASKSLYLGGIVGTLMGASAISGCSNTGVTNLNASNNTDTPAENIFADGGIAGFIKGTASNHISISDCSWNYSEGNVGARRGTCGGIVAYSEYADISDCDVTVVYNMYNHVTGGIVGWAVNSTLSNCKFHGTKITATQGYFSAGIVAKLDSGSIVDGCYNYCKDITAPKAATVIGEIAATSVAGSTIKNCHHTGTIAICSDTNFTDGGGNVSDL